MTVVYTHEVATGRGFGNFGRLLFRWKGSIYKLVLPDLILYIFLYGCISLVYRFGLRRDIKYQMAFGQLVKYCSDHASTIPVSFVLGFYVSQIVTRWWSQFMTLPWPDNLAIVVATGVHGHDDRSRLFRRSIMRYINLSFVMVMIMISSPVKKRFPTMDHLVEAGFMMPHEKLIIEELNKKTDHPKYWVPIIWAGTLATKARKEGKILDDQTLAHLISQVVKWRGGLGDILGYDWVCIPIVYTQVVTLAVYLYFIAALLGKQFVESEKELDLFVPVFLFLEFFFYMGWLKVAETMVNPFGEDDDDFEINWMIDRNITVSYIIVDEMHSDIPELVKDAYWDEVVPEEIPYTASTAKFKIDAPQGSAAEAEKRKSVKSIPSDEKRMLTVKFAPDFDYYDSVSLPGTPQKSRENTAMSFISEDDSGPSKELTRKKSMYAHLLEKDDEIHQDNNHKTQNKVKSEEHIAGHHSPDRHNKPEYGNRP